MLVYVCAESLLHTHASFFSEQIVFLKVNHRGPLPWKELHFPSETIVWRSRHGGILSFFLSLFFFFFFFFYLFAMTGEITCTGCDISDPRTEKESEKRRRRRVSK